MKERLFEKLLKEICKDNNFQINFYSDSWLASIKNPETGKVTKTVGYNFDLNSALSHNIVNDKVLTSEVLELANVPNIRHHFIINDYFRNRYEFAPNWEDDFNKIMKEIKEYPIVVKPVGGSMGRDVFLCSSPDEAKQNIIKIIAHDSAAVCKYYESEFEYRFYVLDSEILLAYKKIKTSDWKHNLSEGAKPEIIDISSLDYPVISKLALVASKIVGLRAGAVDILETSEGLKVLEINSGIAMDKFSSISQDNYQIAKEVHKKYLIASLSKH